MPNTNGPIARNEHFLAGKRDERGGNLNTSITREERMMSQDRVTPEEINSMISDALVSYYDMNHVDTALNGKAAASHSHAQADVTGLADSLAGKAAASHAHDDRYYTETETDTLLAGKSDTGHLHDDRYYTETETDNKLGEKSNTGHLHDDRYYTEDETDTLLSGKADSSDIPDVSAFITRLVNDLVNYYTKRSARFRNLRSSRSIPFRFRIFRTPLSIC